MDVIFHENSSSSNKGYLIKSISEVERTEIRIKVHEVITFIKKSTIDLWYIRIVNPRYLPIRKNITKASLLAWSQVGTLY